MPTKRKMQILVDFAMTALLPLLMAYSMIGETAHEWLGATMLVLFVVHHVLNFRWFKFFARGKYTPVRIFSTIVSIANIHKYDIVYVWKINIDIQEQRYL